ncbi:MAG: FimB/Mfa2 family fimbrial subunit [Bacteroides sp.]|nr:FimB/Mfa2 family fimbrial subunit [Bacteroides sp.]
MSSLILTDTLATTARKAVFCVLLFLLPASCVRKDVDGCVQYALDVRVVDNEGNDLTESGILEKTDVYLFNQKGFVRMVPAGISSAFLFGEDKNERLTLVAWGNVKEDTLVTTQVAVGTSLEDARLQLRRHAEGTHIPVTDLFYCRKELNDADMEDTEDTPQTRGGMREDGVTLVMERMAAGVSVHTIGFTEKYPEGGGPCHIVVRGAGTEMDFTGKAVGDEAGYKPLSYTDGAGDLRTQPFHVFPTNDGQHIAIDICRQGEMLFTVTQNNKFEPICTPAGKQTDILLDFRYATLQITVTVLPWGEVSQDTEM